MGLALGATAWGSSQQITCWGFGTWAGPCLGAVEHTQQLQQAGKVLGLLGPPGRVLGRWRLLWKSLSSTQLELHLNEEWAPVTWAKGATSPAGEPRAWPWGGDEGRERAAIGVGEIQSQLHSASQAWPVLRAVQPGALWAVQSQEGWTPGSREGAG